MRRSSRSSRRSRSSSQWGWFIVGFRQNQSWIILALSRETIDSDVRVSSRQHCSWCTVMCHCWQTAACPWLVSISSSLACQPWVYCVTVYCVDGWLISRRISKMYPRELCHLTKGFTPIKAMSFTGSKWRRDLVWSNCISIIQELPVLHCPTCHPPLMILM